MYAPRHGQRLAKRGVVVCTTRGGWWFLNRLWALSIPIQLFIKNSANLLHNELPQSQLSISHKFLYNMLMEFNKHEKLTRREQRRVADVQLVLAGLALKQPLTVAPAPELEAFDLPAEAMGERIDARLFDIEGL